LRLTILALAMIALPAMAQGPENGTVVFVDIAGDRFGATFYAVSGFVEVFRDPGNGSPVPDATATAVAEAALAASGFGQCLTDAPRPSGLGIAGFTEVPYRC
jgi:hypothetical protein